MGRRNKIFLVSSPAGWLASSYMMAGAQTERPRGLQTLGKEGGREPVRHRQPADTIGELGLVDKPCALINFSWAWAQVYSHVLITPRPAAVPQEGFCQWLHKSGLAASFEPSAVLSPDIREDAAVCSSPPPPHSGGEGLCSAGKYDKIQLTREDTFHCLNPSSEIW